MLKKILKDKEYFVIFDDHGHSRAPKTYHLYKRIYASLKEEQIFSHNQEIYYSFYKACVMKRFNALTQKGD